MKRLSNAFLSLENCSKRAVMETGVGPAGRESVLLPSSRISWSVCAREGGSSCPRRAPPPRASENEEMRIASRVARVRRPAIRILGIAHHLVERRITDSNLTFSEIRRRNTQQFQRTAVAPTTTQTPLRRAETFFKDCECKSSENLLELPTLMRQHQRLKLTTLAAPNVNQPPHLESTSCPTKEPSKAAHAPFANFRKSPRGRTQTI